MNFIHKVAIILAFFSTILSQAAQAAIDNNMNISNIGAQGNKGYMMFSTSPSQTCAYQTIYIDLQTEGGKAMYATALSAHLSGKRVTRVEYSVDAGICNASLVEI